MYLQGVKLMGAGLKKDGAPIVQRIRGEWTESVHVGHIAVVDAGGRLLAWAGDPGRIVWMGSAVNPLAALPLVLHGVAGAGKADDTALALLAGRQQGTVQQTSRLDRLLQQHGIEEAELALPAVYPLDTKRRMELMCSKQPQRRLYHPAAGRHIAALVLSRALGCTQDGYTEPGHPAQQQVMQCVAACASIEEQTLGVAQDDCGSPALALPLWRLALAYARLAAPQADGADAALAAAARRVTAAMNRHPDLVEGPGRLSATLLGDANVIASSVEQGVYAFALRQQRLGVAVSIADGCGEALPLAVAAILESLAATAGPAGPQHADGPRRLAAAVRSGFPAARLDAMGREIGRMEALATLSYGERYPRVRF